MAFPHSIFLAVTTDCDKTGECAWCFNNLEPDRRVLSKLSKEDIVVFLKKMRLMNVRDIYFTGGEPLLRKDLNEMIYRAHGMGLNTYLLSNGRSLTKDRVERLDGCGLDVFVLSLAALEQADRKTINVVRKFDKARLSFIFVITRENFSLVAETIRMARALQAGIIFQPAYIPRGHELRETLSVAGLDPFDWSELHTHLKLWANELGFRDYLDLVYATYHKGELRPRWCGMGRQAFVLDADGEVYPCFHRRDLACGSILKQETAEILENLSKHAAETSNAACFGEHCLSLHTSYCK